MSASTVTNKNFRNMIDGEILGTLLLVMHYSKHSIQCSCNLKVVDTLQQKAAST